MLTEKDYKEFATLASRLAESVLMDWDKEEQVRLAKEVACECHKIFNEKENREFVELVKRMREAEEALLEIASLDDEPEIDIRADKVDMLKREVDEYLKKMEV